MKKIICKMLVVAAAVAMASACAPKAHKIQITAHRGFWKCEEAQFAENSIKSLALAQEHGLWGSEFDIRLTSDSIVVVNHNEDFHGLVVIDHTYAELQEFKLENGEKLPTLDDYLTQGEKSDKTVLVVELKPMKSQELDELLTQKTLAALKAHNLYDPKRAIFISFSKYISDRIAELAPEFTNQYLGGEIAPDDLVKNGINGIDYHFSVFDKNPGWIEQARAHDMSINVWTVNDSTDIQRMIDFGVDCITTNEPLRVRGMLDGNEFVIK